MSLSEGTSLIIWYFYIKHRTWEWNSILILPKYIAQLSDNDNIWTSIKESLKYINMYLSSVIIKLIYFASHSLKDCCRVRSTWIFLFWKLKIANYSVNFISIQMMRMQLALPRLLSTKTPVRLNCSSGCCKSLYLLLIYIFLLLSVFLTQNLVKLNILLGNSNSMGFSVFFPLFIQNCLHILQELTSQ